MRLTTPITSLEILYKNPKQGRCYRATLENGKQVDLYVRYGTLTQLVTIAKKKKKGDYVLEWKYVPLYSSDAGIFVTRATDVITDEADDIELIERLVRV